jgi:integrase
VLALYTGQRRGDLVSMTWDDYDGRHIRVRQQKTGAELLVPVHPTLKRELDAWKRESKGPFVLLTARGDRWQPGSLTHRLAYILAREKLPHIGIHGMRKLAAQNLAEAGCTANEIAAVTGHRTLAMVQLYTAGADQKRLAGTAIGRLS